MKEIIQQIMSDLSYLTPPFNPVKLKHIFEKHPVLDIAHAPSQLIPYVQQLITLRALIEKSFAMAAKKHHLSLQQAHLVELKKLDETFQQKANEYQKQIQSAIDLLNSSFLVLKPLIKENLPEQNLASTDYNASTDNKLQQLAVLEFQTHINKIIGTINSNRAKINLLQLKNKIGELVIELNTLGVSCTTISVMKEFQSIVATTTLTIKQLEEISMKSSILISQIEKQIPPSGVQEKLKEIARQLATINSDLEKVQFDISINTLAIEIKSSLSEEFNKATDKAELVKRYQDQVPSTLLSYFDLPAWSRWAEDHKKYEASNREKENSFNYLALLEKKDALLSLKMRLDAQSQILDSLLPKLQSTSPIDSELTNLLQQAKELLQKYPFAFPANIAMNSSLTDFYLVLYCNLPLLEKKLQRMNLIRHAADELSSTAHRLNDLRKNYTLPPEQDVLLVRQSELEEQISLLPSEELLAKWLNFCKSFLESDAKLVLLLQQQHEVQTQRSNIGVQIDKANLETLDESFIKSIEEEFINLQNEIASSIEQVKLLALDFSNLEIPSDAPTGMGKEPFLPTDKQNAIPISPITELEELASSTEQAILLPQPDTKITEFTLPDTKEDTKPIPISPMLTPAQSVTLHKEVPIELPKYEDGLTTPMLLFSGANEPPTPVERLLLEDPAVGLLTDISTLTSIPEEQRIHSEKLVDLPKPIEPAELMNRPESLTCMIVTPIVSSPIGSDEQQSVENTILTEPSTTTVPIAPTAIQHVPTQVKPIDEIMQPTDKVTVRASAELSAQVIPEIQASIVIASTATEPLHLAQEKETLKVSSITTEEHDTTVAGTQPIPTADKPADPPLTEEPSTLRLTSSPQGKEPDSIEDSELQKLEDYHQRISDLLVNCATEVQEWYLETGKALGAYLINHPTSYKPSYVLRDILFELQHNSDLNTIRAYMRLCPHPENDLEKLLAIKPNLPLVDEPFDEENEVNDAPEQFKLLYAQYLKLRERHPVEGALLLQAIQSLRMAKVFKDAPNTLLSMEHVPSLALDPRYEPLKRHRGFLRIWEIIEDLYRWIVGIISGQAEYEYSKRPCLFKTKTAQLLEEADLVTQKDLPPVCLN